MKREMVCAALVGCMAITALMGAMIVVGSEQAPADGPHYTPSSPIRIDDDLELAAAASDGSGTYEDPWLIDGLEIDGTGEGYGIYIGNTTEYWLISGCHIYNVDQNPSWWFYVSAGIHVYDCQYGEIMNCSINNTASYGMLFSNGTTEIGVHDNTIWNCSLRGIALTDTDDCMFETNYIYGNSTSLFGFTFDDLSDGHTLDGNYVGQTLWAGIGFNDSWTVDMTNNIVEGVIDLDPDTSVLPFYGIFGYNSAYMDIDTNTVLNCTLGIGLVGTAGYEVFDSTITDNELDGCYGAGIVTSYVNNVTVSGNTIYNLQDFGGEIPTVGIAANEHTNNTTISSNYVSDQTTGINVSSPCDNLTIYDNHLSDNIENAWDENADTAVAWYYGWGGNWWDDLTSPDDNNNGVVDVPYNVSGEGDNYDLYPRCTKVIIGGGGGSYTRPVIPVEEPVEEPAEDTGWCSGTVMAITGVISACVAVIWHNGKRE